MKGKKSIGSFQRAAGGARRYAAKGRYSPLSSHIEALCLGVNGLPHLIREANIRENADIESGYFYINESGTAES
jgi:hypothetical protein